MSRLTGIVENFRNEKGFGFIKPDDGGNSVFVHHSEINMEGYKSLAKNDQVEYDLVEDPKGPRAANVVKI
ncbi:MAG: cold shock domain-containing protein [Pedobacter sp.]|nr:MAG: cold shock domain-containing protein [Pedobacter sp.]